MTVEPLQIEKDDAAPAGVYTLWLDQGDAPVIVLDRPLIERLEDALDRIPQDAQGLVVASRSSRVFVAGADLKTILHASDQELHEYLAYASSVFGKLANLPMTTACAINGAALGGGLELAMHCDGLIGAPGPKPYPVGLPEASLKICPGWGGTNLLPARMAPMDAIRRTASGTTMMFDEAVTAGLFDRVAPSQESLLQTARAWVGEQPHPQRDGAPLRWIGRSPEPVREALATLAEELERSEPGRAVREAIEAGLQDGWNHALEVEQSHLVRLRASDEGRAAIEAFFARSAKR